MIAALKFVMPSTAKKALFSELSHIIINNGTAYSFDGHMALRASINLDITAAPKAYPLLQAIKACADKGAMKISFTKADNLSIQTKGFRTTVPCIDKNCLPLIFPSGKKHHVPEGTNITMAFTLLQDIVLKDNYNSWANGILLAGNHAYATNNTVLVEYNTHFTMPFPAVIPRATVKKLANYEEEPEYIQVTQQTVTFHLSDDKSITTSLLPLTWPDVRKILYPVEYSPLSIDPELFGKLKELKPFTNDKVFLNNGYISTNANTDVENETMLETTVLTEHTIKKELCFSIDDLLNLEYMMDMVDFSQSPAIFQDHNGAIRGAILSKKV